MTAGPEVDHPRPESGTAIAWFRRRSWYPVVFVAVKDHRHISQVYHLPKSGLFEYTR